jgi:hypothetical protein
MQLVSIQGIKSHLLVVELVIYPTEHREQTELLEHYKQLAMAEEQLLQTVPEMK